MSKSTPIKPVTINELLTDREIFHNEVSENELAPDPVQEVFDNANNVSYLNGLRQSMHLGKSGDKQRKSGYQLDPSTPRVIKLDFSPKAGSTANGQWNGAAFGNSLNYKIMED